jgi:hypothetical protein
MLLVLVMLIRRFAGQAMSRCGMDVNSPEAF